MDRLDLTGFKRAEMKDQPLPMLIWVRLEDLVVDRRYQRGITPKGRSAIQRIANNWDWRKYQPVLVAPSDGGKMAIVDGQHRAHAAALVGLDEIPAMTVAMTLQEQAAGFAAINRDRVTISLNQIYRAELAAGAEWAIQCRDAVTAAGCEISTYTPNSASRRPGIVYSVSLIRRMVANGEAAAVTAGLGAVRQSLQAAEVEAYSGGTLAPWLTAIARSQKFLRLPLSEIFDTLDITSMIDAARLRARQMGGSARVMVTNEIEERLREFTSEAAA